jgi:pimeloyl-ACP methyl ester carboxylesterase
MGTYVDVGALELWYDERPGPPDPSHPPVVLLHGGTAHAGTWAFQADVLAESRRVLMPEQRGHGHTPDAGEMSYDLMTAETGAFLDALGTQPVDLVGWSDGGVIAIHLALARPDLVRKVVTIGSNFHFEGTLPEFFGDGEPDDDLNPMRDDYARMSPDGPEHWAVVNAKVVAMWRSSPQLTVDDIARIDVPFLVLVADDDAVAFEHTLDLYRALPQGQLAVVPGASHLVPIEKPDLVNRLVLDFLDDGAVVSILPIRRASDRT